MMPGIIFGDPADRSAERRAERAAAERRRAAKWAAEVARARRARGWEV